MCFILLMLLFAVPALACVSFFQRKHYNFNLMLNLFIRDTTQKTASA